jgi:hypothetical protein
MGKQGSPFAAELPGLEQRNAEIVRRYKAGEELASIGVSLDLMRERIRQIVRNAGARMPREYKCAVPDCFTSPRSPGRYCFAHQRRLDRFGDPLGTRPAAPGAARDVATAAVRGAVGRPLPDGAMNTRAGRRCKPRSASESAAVSE